MEVFFSVEAEVVELEAEGRRSAESEGWSEGLGLDFADQVFWGWPPRPWMKTILGKRTRVN